jgi:caffeoyl-CoA O-methyltransferase
VVLTLVDEEVERYATDHTVALDPVYDRLRDATWENTDCPQMQVGPLEGRLLCFLARLSGARRAVEIGTFTGYSGLSIAEGLAEGGTLVTCDIDPVATAIAQAHWDQVPWGAKIDLRLGLAADTLATVDGPLDLAFIDADKGNYTTYWELLVPKMRTGGLIVVDNVLWSGRVLDPQEESARAIAAFNDHAHGDTRMEAVMLTVRDGILLAVKR